MLFLKAIKNLVLSFGETMIDFPPSYLILIRSKERAGLDSHDLENSMLEIDKVKIFHLNGPL
jgi:hypothetical protein